MTHLEPLKTVAKVPTDLPQSTLSAVVSWILFGHVDAIAFGRHHVMLQVLKREWLHSTSEGGDPKELVPRLNTIIVEMGELLEDTKVPSDLPPITQRHNPCLKTLEVDGVASELDR